MSEPAVRPWWLWPNLLSLDAPAVAVVWQLFLAAEANVDVPLAAVVVLGLVVWGVYLADRSLDAARGCVDSDRHQFAAKHPALQFGLGGCAFLAAGILAFVALPHDYLTTGAAVATVTGAYLLAVHAGRRWLGAGAKELSVGVVFAAGVSVPLAADATAGGAWLPGVTAFAGLCALNCLLIARWEEPIATASRWAFALAGLAVCAALAAAPDVMLAVALSAAALALLHVGRRAMSVRAARVLADVALLSPLLVAVIS